MRKIQLNSKVAEGKLIRNRNQLTKAIANFEAKEVVITIEKKQSKRSSPQNNYLWGVVYEIVKQGLYDATGETMSSNAIHYELLLPKFAPEREIVNKETGEVITQKITSSAMTKSEFSEYVDNISKFASEFLNVEIPASDQELILNFK